MSGKRPLIDDLEADEDDHKASERLAAETARRRVDQEQKRKLELARAAQREAEFGGSLDALGREEIESLAQRVAPVLDVPEEGQPPTGLLREMLLVELERVSKESEG